MSKISNAPRPTGSLPLGGDAAPEQESKPHQAKVAEPKQLTETYFRLRRAGHEYERAKEAANNPDIEKWRHKVNVFVKRCKSEGLPEPQLKSVLEEFGLPDDSQKIPELPLNRKQSKRRDLVTERMVDDFKQKKISFSELQRMETNEKIERYGKNDAVARRKGKQAYYDKGTVQKAYKEAVSIIAKMQNDDNRQ